MFCPICGCRSLEAFRGRSVARCTGCGSLERHRVFGLFLIERYQQLKGRAVLALPRSPLLKLGPLARNLVRRASPPEIRAMPAVDAVLLCHEFAALDRSVEDFFADARRNIAVDGFVAFTGTPSKEPAAGAPDAQSIAATVDTSAQDGNDGSNTDQAGGEALASLRTLPGWKFTVWRPEASFGKTISKAASLRYTSGDPRRGLQLIIAVPRE